MDWDKLFETNGDDLIRICWRILGSRADVEDCVQETFVQAIQTQQRDTVRNWPGLLRRIAVMTALAALRRRKVRQSTRLSPSANELPARGETPDQAASRRELEERLRREVAGLPDREASVFCLRYFELMSLDETADTLGISSGAAAAASHRARRHLEQQMADVLPTTAE